MAEAQPSPAWDSCDNLDASQRVVIKEGAVQAAQRFFKKLQNMVQVAVDDSKAKRAQISGYLAEPREWLQQEELLSQKHRHHQILVGVAGRSGAGKTSAINAWLGVRDLLPSSCSQAATAVVCLVSWNYDERPGRAFRAEIDFHSLEEIRKDVDQFYQSVRELDVAQDDLEHIADLNAQMNEFFEKAKVLWGFTLDKLKAMTADELLASNPQITQLLGTTRNLHNASSERLSDRVRPFLDSTAHTHGGSDKFAAWPLVKCVRIFLRADILKNGITLVDLPGLGDMNGCRAQVAKNFYPRLAVTIIVAQIHRAADEKMAHDLLDGYHEIRLQLDGKFHHKGLGFVLTQTDAIDISSFLKSFRDDPAIDDAANLHEQATVLAHEASCLGNHEADEEKALKKLIRDGKKIQTKLNKLRKQLREADEPEQDAINRDIADLQTQKQEADQKVGAQKDRAYKIIKSKTRKVAEHHKMHSKVVFECIRLRSIFVRKRIQHDVAQRQHQHLPQDGPIEDTDSSPPIEVVPTSSAAFWGIKEDEEMPGFPSEKSTGIPHVRQWLKEITLGQREEHLDAILNEYSSLLHPFYQWSQVSEEDVKGAFTKQDVEECLSPVHDRFTQTLALDIDDLTEKLQQLNPLRRKEDFTTKSMKKAAQIISDWSLRFPDNKTSSERMPWGTYGAILRRVGENYKSGFGVEYKWLDQLSIPALENMLRDWRTEIHHSIPELRDGILERFEVSWNDYMRGISQNLEELSPDLKTNLERREHALDAIRKTMRDRLSSAIMSISTNASLAHPQFRASLQQSLEPVFREALAITGTGSYQARRNLVTDKCVPKTKVMFTLAFGAIEVKLAENKTKAKEQISGIPGLAKLDVERQLNRMLPQDIPDGEDNAESRLHEVKFQQAVHVISTQWQVEWFEPSTGLVAPKSEDSDSDAGSDSQESDADDESDSGSETNSESTLGEDDEMEDDEPKGVKREREVEVKEEADVVVKRERRR